MDLIELYLAYFQSIVNQQYLRLIDLIDIGIIAVVIYHVFLWIKGTRAIQLLKGLFILFSVYFISHMLGLYTIDWLMEKLVTFFVIVLIVVFQPELRNALEKLGRRSFFNLFAPAEDKLSTGFVQNIIKSVVYLAENKLGALIVMERKTGLNEYVESGTLIDSTVSAELLTCIFFNKNPLHDGALVIRGSRILAAGCLLPLTENRILDKRLGTRHRAALGLTEQSDALVIVVSEETGIISIAENGTLTRYLTKETLEERLFNCFMASTQKREQSFHFWRKHDKKTSA